MSEELAFQQTFRQRAAVHRHHGSGPPAAGHVQGARAQFLAGTGFAGDQYGSAAAGHQPDDVLELTHLATASHQHPLPVFAAHVGRHSRQVAAPSVFDRLVD